MQFCFGVRVSMLWIYISACLKSFSICSFSCTSFLVNGHILYFFIYYFLSFRNKVGGSTLLLESLS